MQLDENSEILETDIEMKEKDSWDKLVSEEV